MSSESGLTASSRWWQAKVPFPLVLALTVSFGMILLVWSNRQSFGSWSGIPFVLGVLLFIYVPGVVTLRLFGFLRQERAISLAISTGIISGLALYWILAPLLPRFGYTALCSLALLGLLFRRSEWLGTTLPRPCLEATLGALAVSALAVWGLSQTTYRGAQRSPDGGMSYLHSQLYLGTEVGGSDALFHAAVTEAIARTPAGEPNPFVSGEPLAYHRGMDLLAALFSRELGIDPIDLASRLFPTLFLLALSALVYGAGRALGLTWGPSLLATLLIFGADFGILLYLFPIHPDWPLKYWLPLFTSYPATSFFWVNPHLPALVIFTGGLIVLARSEDDGVRKKLLAGILLGATALFKVYLAFHIAMALGAATLFCLWRARSRTILGVSAVAAVVMGTIALDNRLYTGSQVEMRFSYLPPAMASLRAAELAPLAEVLLEARTAPHPFTILSALAALGFYLVMVLGVRVAAIPRSVGWLRTALPASSRVFLALFFLLGPLPPLFWVVSVSGLNSTYFFFNQSLFAGSILLAEAIAGISRPRRRAVAAAVVLLLSLTPSLRDRVFWGSLPAARWSPDELEAAMVLREASRPDEVVLHPVNRKRPSPASHIAGLPTVLTYWQGYPFSFADPAEIERRAHDLDVFFRTDEVSVARSIIERYGVGWIYSLKASHPVRFRTEDLLRKAYENDSVVLYRVQPSPPDAPLARNE